MRDISVSRLHAAVAVQAVLQCLRYVFSESAYRKWNFHCDLSTHSRILGLQLLHAPAMHFCRWQCNVKTECRPRMPVNADLGCLYAYKYDIIDLHVGGTALARRSTDRARQSL